MSTILNPWNCNHVLQQIGFQEASQKSKSEKLELILSAIQNLNLFAFLVNWCCSLWGGALENQAERLIKEALQAKYTVLTNDPQGTAARAERLVRYLLQIRTLPYQEPPICIPNPLDLSHYPGCLPDNVTHQLFNMDFLRFADPAYKVRHREFTKRCRAEARTTQQEIYQKYKTDRASLQENVEETVYTQGKKVVKIDHLVTKPPTVALSAEASLSDVWKAMARQLTRDLYAKRHPTEIYDELVYYHDGKEVARMTLIVSPLCVRVIGPLWSSPSYLRVENAVSAFLKYCRGCQRLKQKTLLALKK